MIPRNPLELHRRIPGALLGPQYSEYFEGYMCVMLGTGLVLSVQNVADFKHLTSCYGGVLAKP